MPVLSSMVGQHFAYASGRSGVLQQILLTMSDRDRLLGAKDLTEAEAILTELKMTNPIDQGLKRSDEILNAIEAWARSEVEQMTPESKQETFSILWMENDIPLLSYLIKERMGLTSAISTVPSDTMSSYTVEQLRDYLENGNEGTLPAHLVTFLRETVSQEDVSPQSIDSAVAQYVCDLQRKLARSSGSKLIMKYVRHKIDLTNIRTALRLLKSETTDESHLIMGGTIETARLTKDRESIFRAIDASPLPYELSTQLRAAGDDTNAIELALSQVIANDIAAMWNIPLSIEPVFAFAALTLSQLKLLRTLLIGKRAAMSPQEIKQVLPPFLSASHYVL